MLAEHRPSPLIVAHRGFSAVAPENTLAAFAAAIRAGADMIELDVAMTADGDAVCLHDDTVDRTTDGHGRVATMSTDTIRRLDAGSWFGPGFRGERVPTLTDALDLARRRVGVNIEIKADPRRGQVVAAVAEAVAAVAAGDEVVVSSFNPEMLAQLHAAAPDLRTALLVEDRRSHRRAVGDAVEAGARGLHVALPLADPRTLAAARRRGLRLGVYTVNSTHAARRLAGIGAALLITDRPDRLLEALRGAVPTLAA
jgi:glycerophosphoryl diester phosphodiesterase